MEDSSGSIQQLLAEGMELLYTNPEKSGILFERAREMAEQQDDRLIMAEVYQNLSIYHWARGDQQKAMICDREALKLYRALDDLPGIAYALNGLGVSLLDLGLNHEALKNFLESERMMTELSDSTGLQMVYLNLGVVFDNMQDYSASMDFYRKALNLGLKLELYNEVADVYNNMAEIDLKRGMLDAAFEQYSQAFKIYKKADDLPGMVLVKGNLAEYYRQTGRYAVSEELFFDALDGYRRMEDKHGQCEILLGIGKLYRSSAQFAKSERYLEAAIQEAREHQYIELLIQAQRQLAQVMYEQQHYDEAYHNFLAYDLLKDSLHLTARTQEFDNLRMAYEAEESERQLAALRSEREKERIISEQKDRLRNALLAIVGLLLLFAVIGVMLYSRLRKAHARLGRQQAALEAKNREVEDTAAQLKVANEKLYNEKRLAEISSAAKAEFVSVLSHEIRTPLNAVIGISHVLQEEVKDGHVKQYLDALTHSANTLLGFTNNILDLSKIDAGKIELNEEPIIFKELFNQINLSFVPALKQKGLEMKIRFDDDVPPQVVGDRMRLTQILLNLMSNAIKYTDKGSITITVKCAGRQDGNWWIHFNVTDTGQGISTELKPKIFDRYSRLQKESTLTPQGSGLGLSITKSLVELLGGTIQFTSEAGVGTTFKVALQFKPKEAKAPGLNGNLNGAFANGEVNGRSVLLVEDNEVNVMVTERLLKKLNLKVTVARDGIEAVSAARSQRFDLILMDLQMPKLNGIEATERILQHQPEARIIALTANTDQQVKSQIRKSGFRDMLIKPFRPEDFGGKITGWLRAS